MKKAAWKRKITEQCREIGTYKMAFDPVIDTLAQTLEERDKVHEEYIKSGEMAVVEYTNKYGATNTTKNPRIVLWDDLNKSALAIWKELGLTPAGYKKITGEGTGKSKGNSLWGKVIQLEGS